MTKSLYQSWTRDIVQSDGFGKKGHMFLFNKFTHFS